MMVKNSNNKIRFDYMDKAQKHNSDGYGVAWFEDGFVKTYKTFDYNTFKGVVSGLRKFTLVIHLRYATKGDKTYSNIHPFDTPSGVMFHNGTMYGMGDSKRSDSQVLADTLMECDYEDIKNIQPLIKPYINDKINRLVFFEDRGEIVIMNKELGIEEDGDWYSNDYHKKNDGWCRGQTTVKPATIPIKEVEDTKKYDVFVYGTLKKGGHNHDRFLRNAEFIGSCKSITKWSMIGEGKSFPYLLEKNVNRGKHIEGEVYRVTSGYLKRLDALEGVPLHYKRNYIPVKYDDGSEATVMVYTKTTITSRDLEEKFISNWQV